MPAGVPDPKEVGRYYALAQVGLEMAAPIGLGLLVDNYLETGPWGVVLGTIFGLVGGLWHLVVLSNRFEDPRPNDPRRDQP